MFVNPLNCKDQKKGRKRNQRKMYLCTTHMKRYFQAPKHTPTTECHMTNVQLNVVERLRSENVAIKIILSNKQFSFSVRFRSVSIYWKKCCYNSNIAKYRHSSLRRFFALDGLITAPDAKILLPLILFNTLLHFFFFFALSALRTNCKEKS